MTSSTAGHQAESAISKRGRRTSGRSWAARRLIPAGAAAALLLFGLAPQLASAGQLRAHAITSTVSNLDRNADTSGPIVIASSGTGYVAWQHPASGGRPDTVLFCVIPSGGRCKKPLVLPFPKGAATYGITQPFPVLGGASKVVYVVGPSYVTDNTVIWTSTNGGASFSKGYIVPGDSYAGDTSVYDVLRLPDAKPKVDFFAIGSANPGLGFSFAAPTITECITCSFTFNAGGVAGAVAGATLGLVGNGAVEAFWTDANTPTVDYFWSKYDDLAVAGAWSGPIKVGDGDNARLASGPKGLFLLSQDFAGHESDPTRLDVRKWNPETHKFGPPLEVANESTSTESPYIGGFGEDAVTGALYVAWEAYTSKGDVMNFWISTDGGSKWSAATAIAKLSRGDVDEARVAVSKGKGFLTFHDAAGLHLVDLAHL